MRKPIIIRKLRLIGGRGITIWPFIIISTHSPDPERTFKHECMHWYQIHELGVLKFYWKIIIEYIKYGQRDGPLEKAAYAYSDEPFTEREREWYNGS